MKKSFLFIVLVFALILSACAKNKNLPDNSGNVNESDTSINQPETPSSDRDSDEEILSIIDDYLHYTTISTDLIHSTFEYSCFMWETIYKYSDHDDVADTFKKIIESSGSREVIEDANEIIGRLYVEILSSDYDEECISIISKCHTNYLWYQGCFLNPTGEYSAYRDLYFQARVAYMEEADYNMVDYFKEIGYERKDRST